MSKMQFQERSARTRLDRFNTFVEQGQKKHGVGRFDYTLAKVDYINTRTPVRIICTKCKGVISIRPQDHVSKQKNRHGWCEKCAIESGSRRQYAIERWRKKLTQRIERFKQRAKHCHDEKYRYPLLENEYKVHTSTITIQCTHCNRSFKMKASSHICEDRYGGCPYCNEKRKNEIIAKKNRERQMRNKQTLDQPRTYGCIYKITHVPTNRFYIGYTTMSAHRRFRAHYDKAKFENKKSGKASSYLHRSMVAHGISEFSCSVVGEMRNVSPVTLAKIEKKVIRKLNPDFNVSGGGEIGNYRKRQPYS